MAVIMERQHTYSKALLRTIYILFVVMAAIPLYLNTSTIRFNLLTLLTSDDPAAYFEFGLNIHFGILTTVIAACVAIAAMFVKQKIRLAPEVPFVIGLLFCFSLSVLVGQFYEPGLLNVVFYIQTVIPIMAFFVGAFYPISKRMVWLSLKLIVLCNTAVLLMVYVFLLRAVSRGIFSGLTAFVRELSIVIPQFNDYYPFAFVISLSTNIALLRGSHSRAWRIIWIVCLLVHAAYPPISWSRTALVLAVIVVFVHFVIYLWARVRSPAQLMNKLSTIVLASFALIAISLIVLTASTVRERVSSQSVLAQSDSRRVDLAKEASVLILQSPVVGRMFIPEWGSAADGTKREVKRLFGAHNQYLDYGLRGGVAALFFTLTIFLVSAWRNWMRLSDVMMSTELQVARNAWAATVVTVIIGNNTQLFLVQAYTGTLIWFLVGTMARLNGRRAPM